MGGDGEGGIRPWATPLAETGEG